MEYATLNNGVKMPMAGIGTFLLTPDEAEASVISALQNGYRLIAAFDVAQSEVGKEISDDALFTVGLQNYHFKNIESFFNISYDTLCKLQKPRSVATSCQDILMEYFREHEMLDAAVDG